MKYSLEYDHIEFSSDELSYDLFGRKSLNDLSYREYVSVMKLKRELIPRLAAAMGGEYYMSVSLSNTSRLDDVYYFATGECDGVIKDGEEYCVAEIRVVNKYRRALVGDEFYTARLYFHAYFLARQKEVDRVRLCLATYNTENGEVTPHYTYASVGELRTFYMNALDRIHKRGKFISHSSRERIPTLCNAIFPYRGLRESQADMIKECYRDIKNHNRLFCEAPTGIGKTISTLYPAIKCMGERVTDKIFYLTSKASIRREALGAVTNMRIHGAEIYTCVLSAKEQACICDSAKRGGGRISNHCKSGVCPYAENYYKRAEDAIFELLDSGYEFDRDDIRRVAQKYGVCPHELSLDLSELCDVIICDYNYVFSPTVYLKRYFADSTRGEKYTFLIDEAHNLPDRARDIFSAKLSSEEFEHLYGLFEENNSLCSSVLDVLKSFDKLGELCNDNSRYDASGTKVGYYVGHSIPQNFSEKLNACAQNMEKWLKYNTESSIYLTVESLYSRIREYKVSEDCFGDNYLVFINTRGAVNEILLYCLDPSSLLDEALDRAVSSVLFSATLTPTEYFADILGGGKKSVSVSFPSPFSPDNLCVAVVEGISTRYEDREKSYKKIASCIAATASAKAGNYIVFLPSYGYMENVAKAFSEKYPKVRTIVQKKGMSYKDRDAFLDFFSDDGRLRIGFCVMGGMFSEGIDLPGNRLIGVLVVGVGLPGLSNERNIIRDYYEQKCGLGYDYAYTYPGMNSVLQAVGRLIRRDTDRGIAVLIDDRFCEPKYKMLFPSQWKNVKFARNSSSLAEIAHIFWENRE